MKNKSEIVSFSRHDNDVLSNSEIHISLNAA
jgi:hypothetical protein